MKRILLIVIGILAGLNTYTYAQVMQSARGTEDMFIGPTGGLGGTWVDRMVPRRDFKLGGNIGVSFLYAKGYNIGWGADLVISAEGHKRSDLNKENITIASESVTPVYARLPLRMYYMVPSHHMIRPIVFAGPVLGYKIAEFSEDNKVLGDMFLRQNSKSYKNFDAGASVGAGLLFRFTDRSWLNVNVNYYHGMVDVYEPYYRDNKIENLTANVGMLFAIR